jgi:hypothetical protein
MSYDEAFYLYENTNLTLCEIADTVGINYSWLHTRLTREYSEEYRKERKVRNYRTSKLGAKNPMKGKRGEAHHNYVGDVSDGKGYLMRVKPRWYTGRKGCKHVFVHHIVMCESLGLTEIPHGFCVHHINGVPTDNRVTNLSLMTMGAHSKLHHLERVTTIQKRSRV